MSAKKRRPERLVEPEKAHSRWVEYSRAKDAMFIGTDIPRAPWYVVDADVERNARLNRIHHLLGPFDYEDLTPEPIVLPLRQEDPGYERPPIEDQIFVPEVY